MANEFEDEQEDDGVLVLGVDVGENKIERAGAETVADHIQHGSKVRTYSSPCSALPNTVPDVSLPHRRTRRGCSL